VTREGRLVRAMSVSGGLFLLAILPELRREGMTFLEMYALHRAIELIDDPTMGLDQPYSESRLARETGLLDYEVSRACSFLRKRGLVTTSRSASDRRIRQLLPTERGRNVLVRIFSAAGRRLWEGIETPSRVRRAREATRLLRSANGILHGVFQLSLFERQPARKKPRRKRAAVRHISMMEQIYG
jgi:DNA-binding MarR family transcriptional regulator